ncbi:hypothetical protein ACWIG5_02135 [Streptomyces lydicus]
MKHACAVAATVEDPVGGDVCWRELQDLHVKSDYAMKACDLA